MWPMLLLSGAHLAGTAHRCRMWIRGGGLAELEHSLPGSLPRSLPVHFRVHFRDSASCHRTAVLGAASSPLGPPLGDMGFLTAGSQEGAAWENWAEAASHGPAPEAA